MDFTIVTKAGITVAEAAVLAEVSQPMMWSYMHGRAIPGNRIYRGRNMRERVVVMLYVLEKLVEKGALPKKDIPAGKRMHPEKKAKRVAMLRKLKSLIEARLEVQPTNE